MKDIKEKLITRKTGRWTDLVPITVLLTVVLMLLPSLTLNSLGVTKAIATFVTPFFGSAAVASFWVEYFAFTGIWILFLFIATVFKGNRPMLKTLVYNKKGNNFRGALIGLLMGIGANSLCVLIAWLSGNIHLTFSSFNPVILLVFFAAVLIQSGAEEVADRCYLYQKLRRGYKNPLVAILGNAVLFSLIHLMNPGINFVAVLNIMAVGLLFSLIVYYFDCLWAAIMLHAGWNFTQNLIFGLPNSGKIAAYSIFKLDSATATPGLFYDVNFGVEGSIGAVCVILLLCVVVYFVGRKYGERRDYWAEEEAQLLKEEEAKAAVETK